MKRIFILTLLIVLLIPAFSYAADYTIYTWGYMDILASMLTAVNKFMGTSEYGTMFKIAALLATFTIFLSLLSDKGFSPVLMFQKILLIIGLQALLFSPLTPNSQTRVIIQDVSDGVIGANPTTVVEGTPIIVAFPLYVLSNIEKATRDILRDQLNKAAGQNGVFLHDMSVITALNMMDTANNMRISDVNFIRSYQSFFENCIMPDVVTGYVDVNQLTNSDNAWDIFGVDLHKSRIGSYYDASTKGTIDGKIMTCDKLYAALDSQIGALGAAAENQISGQLGLAANQSINTILGSVSKDLFNFQNGQTGLLQNAMMLNTFSDAYANLSSSLGMEDNAMGYGMAKAQETAKMTGAMQAVQAKKYLPTAKGYMTVIFVAMIPLIIIIALVTSNFKKPFAMIFGLLLALALWNVGEQLLDFIIIVRTKTLFASSGLSNYNLDSQPFLSSGITDMLNLSLNMYWMIPTLAFSIATLSGFGAASMMGSIAGSANAGIGQAAAEAATGSMSAGNIRMSNINMNKYDAAQTMNAGTSTKMSMDYQQTASNQSSVSTGTRNIHDDADSLKHEGTTFMRNQDGELLRMTGNFEQTGGAWKFSGNVQNLSTGETYTGNMSGMAKDMNSMQQGLNVDDVSMTGKERANLGDVKGENVAFIQGTVVDSNLSASDIIHKDKTRTENTTDEKNYSYERTTDIDTSRTEKDNYIREKKVVEDESIMKNKSYTENDSKNIVKGTKISVGDTVNDYTGAINLVNDGITKYGAHQGAMREALVDNMTKYQDSILQRAGNDQISEKQALDAMGKFHAQVGFEALGNGAHVAFDAALKASVDHSSGQVDTANLNRLMNENIMNQLDADAKANNWTAEQYDQAARERFGAYNDFLKNELGGQVYGPGNASYEVLDGTKNMVGTAANAAGKAADKIDEIGEKHLNKLLK